MSKLVSLLKATMSGGLQLFNYKGKTERSRKIMPFMLGALIGAMILLSASVMTAELKESGNETAILSLYILATVIVIIMEGIYKSSDLLFKPKDNDTLLAMPIKKSIIVAARIIKFYVFELLYCFIFLLPAIIAYAINVAVDASYYLVAITMLFLIPVIPIAISCIIGLITSAISSRFRHKSFLQIILSFIALFITAAFLFYLYSSPDFSGNTIAIMSNNITKYYYPASTFIKLVTNFDLGQYLIFVAINLLIIIVTVFFISYFYFRIVTRMGIIRRSENTDVKYSFIKHGQISAMVKKELTKYFNTPILLMNTAMGLVLFLIAIGVLFFKFDDTINSFISSSENFPLTVDEIRSYLPGVTLAMVAFASLMTFITATMISLEGKAFNLLKSLPISGKKIILAKVLAAMILIVPITALGAIAMFLKFHFSIIDGILVLIAVIVLPLVTELIGILVELKYARFDAESDAVVVKQSASVMISTFTGLGMVLVTISLIFALVFVAGQTVGLIIVDAIFIIVSLFLLMVVGTRGEEKILKLTA